jgi:putative inorganic carbon (hco3(-)) transporter
LAILPVLLYLIALYIRPQDWVTGVVGLPTAFIILPIGLACALANRIREPAHFQIPQSSLMMWYLAIIFVATFVNVGFGIAISETDLFARRIVVYYIIAWTLVSALRIQITIWAVLLLSGFLAYQAYLQATTGTSWGGMTPTPGYEVIRVRWYGDWDGPNVFGLLFVISLAFAIEFIFGPHPIMVRLVASCLAGAYLLAAYYTNSRGAILAIACMVFFYFRSRFKSAFAIALAATVVVGFLMLGPSRMSEVNSNEASARERTWLWEQGLMFLRANPVFGIGRDQFYKKVDLGLIAHNNFVQNFAEMGFVGYFCFVSILWFSFKGNYILSDEKYNLPPGTRAVGRMLTAALVGYVTTTFFVVMELDLLFFVLGLCAASYLVARRQCPDIPKMQFTRLDLLIILSGMFAVLVVIWLAAVKHII